MSTPQAPGPESPMDAEMTPQAEVAPPVVEQPHQLKPGYQQQSSVPTPHQYEEQQEPQQSPPPHWYPEQQWQTRQPWPEQPHPQQWPEQPQYQQPYPLEQLAPGSPYVTNYAPAPHTLTSQKPKHRWILWASIAAGLIVALTIGATAYELGRILAASTPLPNLTEQTSPEPSLASEGELYKQTDEHLTEMMRKYEAMSIDEIAAFFPGGAAGYDATYVRDFQVLLEDLDRRLSEIGAFTVYEDANYDTEILSIRSNADELERSFLHQENFPLGVSVALADGTFYESDGQYFPQGTPEFNATREAFAQSFVPYLDDNGSYAAAGEELVAGLGMNLSYDFQEMFTHCPAEGFVIQDTGSIGAAYCPTVRDTIYVNGQGNNYPNILYDLYFIDLLKHEFAHVRTTGICATSQPAATLRGAHFEATASSYAAMFLGADRDRLAWAAGDYPDYTMTEATDSAAQLIHDGVCG